MMQNYKRQKIPPFSNQLLYMRESYEDDVIYFIKQNIDKYMEMQTADIFSLEEAIQVLDLDISDEKKIALLGFTI